MKSTAVVLVALFAGCDCGGAQTADPGPDNAGRTTQSEALAPLVLFAAEGEPTRAPPEAISTATG